MIDDLVSTIIPVHNRTALLIEAVNSVLAQTHHSIEIVIVDDGSTDETPRVVDDLALQHLKEIRVVHQSNAGAGLAREAGRQLARGEFIQYLDSDDILLPRKFELQLAGLRAHPECGVSYGKTRFCVKGDDQNGVAWKRTGEEIGTMFPSFLRSRWWGTSTPLYRRCVTDVAGPWTPLRNEEDWEYDCRIAAQNIQLQYVGEFISEEREHGGPRQSGSSSSDKAKLRDRARAHQLILRYAWTAGINEAHPEMQHFARELFLLSRQCGAAGLAAESKELFALARRASGVIRGNGWDFRLYRLLASIAGWTRVGKMACYSDSMRK